MTCLSLSDRRFIYDFSVFTALVLLCAAVYGCTFTIRIFGLLHVTPSLIHLRRGLLKLAPVLDAKAGRGTRLSKEFSVCQFLVGDPCFIYSSHFHCRVSWGIGGLIFGLFVGLEELHHDVALLVSRFIAMART
ncbi:unnamed protein product [Brassica oleracea var. botrytis]|uniref:(rape) hypothetical protein n=1 Tax=Brassica napus TaxID=3708 RepID=A0A816IE42_BRANA|nr:unnamed protein product [Brassica napus]